MVLDVLNDSMHEDFGPTLKPEVKLLKQMCFFFFFFFFFFLNGTAPGRGRLFDF